MTTSALNIAINSAPGTLLGRWLASPVENPDFPLTHAEALLEMERMRASLVVPKRPILVLAGYHAWRLMVASTARTMRGLVGGPADHYHSMAYPLSSSIEGIARSVVREVGRIWPHDEPHRTAEIDVIGVSMGGLVARVAAQLPLVDGQKRLRIVRLFTLATPHQGALLAERTPAFLRDSGARDMHPESRFLERLNASLPTAKYELTCYTRLNDKWVGAKNTAPPSREPIWVSGLRFMSHTTVTADARLLVDMARRLRGEEPLARRASAPPTH